MRRNEIRYSKTPFDDYNIFIWAIKPPPYKDWLITGSCGKTKFRAFISLVKLLHKYKSLKELLYVRSIKNE